MKTRITFKTLFHAIVFLACLSTFKATAQNAREFYHTPYNSRNSGSYDRSTLLLSFAYGVPNYLYTGYGVSTYSTRHIGIGPVMGKFEFAIRDEVGLGVVLQGAAKKWRYTAGGKLYEDNAWGMGGAFMGYYHFNKLIPVEKLDVYAGVGVDLSYQELHRDAAYYNYYYDYYGYYYTDAVQTRFNARPNAVVGVRYYVAPKFAFSAEAGYTTFSSFNLGVTFRL
jgi:hypothetical protein